MFDIKYRALFTALICAITTVSMAGTTFIFTNGTAGEENINPSVTPPATDQLLGGFALQTSSTGGGITSVTLIINGAHSGLSNLRLMHVGGSQFGSANASDPGNDAFDFNDTLTITPPLKHSFQLIGDVASGATGTIVGQVVGITTSGGAGFNGFNPPEDMSSAFALPVTVSSFNVE